MCADLGLNHYLLQCTLCVADDSTSVCVVDDGLVIISVLLALYSYSRDVMQSHFHAFVICVQLIGCAWTRGYMGSAKTFLQCKHRTSIAFTRCHYQSASKTEFSAKCRRFQLENLNLCLKPVVISYSQQSLVTNWYVLIHSGTTAEPQAPPNLHVASGAPINSHQHSPVSSVTEQLANGHPSHTPTHPSSHPGSHPGTPQPIVTTSTNVSVGGIPVGDFSKMNSGPSAPAATPAELQTSPVSMSQAAVPIHVPKQEAV